MKNSNTSSKTPLSKTLKKLIIKLLAFLKNLMVLVFNPRFLLCFGIAWIITNGWSYAAAGLGAFFNIPWLTAVAGAYIALLWLPITPEKIITLTISLLLLRKLFPNDTKTLGQLRSLYGKAKSEFSAAIGFFTKKLKKHKEKNENDS